MNFTIFSNALALFPSHLPQASTLLFFRFTSHSHFSLYFTTIHFPSHSHALTALTIYRYSICCPFLFIFLYFSHIFCTSFDFSMLFIAISTNFRSQLLILFKEFLGNTLYKLIKFVHELQLLDSAKLRNELTVSMTSTD